MIDLRSDTVTKPTPEMMEYMMNASVGDDVFDEDPTVNQLQAFAANLFGVEAALFCPSGTMANQIAIKAQTQPGDELICDQGAHIYYYEGGGIAANAGVTTRTITTDRGLFTASQLQELLRPANIHYPSTSFVSIENTCNRGGGKIFDFAEIKAIKKVCTEHNLTLHLDGARLFNALTETRISPQAFGEVFDSISICLSKGLGAPVGSLLLGSQAFISKAVRVRKMLGGGMRQAGYLAAAGLFALKHHTLRLAEDHALAKQIETTLLDLDYVSRVLPVETNMVVFQVAQHVNENHFLNYLQQQDIWALAVDKQTVRLVTHLSLPAHTHARLSKALHNYSASFC